MRVLVVDVEGEGVGVDIALKAQDAGHSVRYWLPPNNDGRTPLHGQGMLDRPKEWETSMDWADLVILTGNSHYAERLSSYFGKGYPIFGANQRGAELELDRGHGQETLKAAGIRTLAYRVVSSADEGIASIVETGKAFAMKPWGGSADKAMTYVSKSPDDGIFILQKWKREGLFKGQLMMQEIAKGIEMGISGFFGPGGWSKAIEESFEHKKFLTGDLGQNTGEMGTVIRHVDKSKLFDEILEPLTDHLHLTKYVGDCSVNCIIDEDGQPWPLEFTMRLGWPDFCIRQAVIQGDPVKWMLDLLSGQDTLRVSTKIAVGVLLAHGDFPKCKDPDKCWSGFPIGGVTGENYSNLSFQQVYDGSAPFLRNGKLRDIKTYLTSGSYVMVVSGVGGNVRTAADEAYSVVKSIRWPSNIMYRTDIGDRLRRELPRLQALGFAEGMEY